LNRFCNFFVVFTVFVVFAVFAVFAVFVVFAFFFRFCRFYNLRFRIPRVLLGTARDHNISYFHISTSPQP
jgi:hypothetical protein